MSGWLDQAWLFIASFSCAGFHQRLVRWLWDFYTNSWLFAGLVHQFPMEFLRYFQ